MSEGANIAELQAAEKHKESGEGKDGFGVGFGDQYATILEGIKWWLLSWHESIISAYNNVFEGLISSGSLITLFGKQGNMFGIKILNDLVEHFSGGGDGGDSAPQDSGTNSDEHGDPESYPHFNDKMGGDFNDFAHGTHDDGYYNGKSFDPGPSPHVGDEHGPAIAG